MWKPFIDKMKSLSESERLEQAEKNIQELKEVIAELGERFEKMEKKRT